MLCYTRVILGYMLPFMLYTYMLQCLCYILICVNVYVMLGRITCLSVFVIYVYAYVMILLCYAKGSNPNT
jgi:hypothetical protein